MVLFKNCSLGNQKWLFYGITARTPFWNLYFWACTLIHNLENIDNKKIKDNYKISFFTVAYTNDINPHDDVLAQTLHIPKNVLAALENNWILNQSPFANK